MDGETQPDVKSTKSTRLLIFLNTGAIRRFVTLSLFSLDNCLNLGQRIFLVVEARQVGDWSRLDRFEA
jgi:hypothetical protein